MFEPIHGSTPKYAGLDKVNPVAMILAVQMMLDWLGERKQAPALKDAAAAVELAVAKVLREGKHLTYDLGGSAKTSECGDAIVQVLDIVS